MSNKNNRILDLVPVAFAITLSILICLYGCAKVNEQSVEATQSEDYFFTVVESYINYKIVYCTETKVMYVESWGNENHGTFTLLVNEDGTPMIYKGDN